MRPKPTLRIWHGPIGYCNAIKKQDDIDNYDIFKRVKFGRSINGEQPFVSSNFGVSVVKLSALHVALNVTRPNRQLQCFIVGQFYGCDSSVIRSGPAPRVIQILV